MAGDKRVTCVDPAHAPRRGRLGKNINWTRALGRDGSPGGGTDEPRKAVPGWHLSTDMALEVAAAGSGALLLWRRTKAVHKDGLSQSLNLTSKGLRRHSDIVLRPRDAA
jgi:hypothetical protein